MKDINFIDAIKSLGFDGVCSFSDVPTSQSDVDTMFRKQVGTDETDTAIMEVGNCPFTYDKLEAERQRLQDLEEAKQYQQDRADAYPSIPDQLDKIYHEGIDGWKADIKAVKDEYPKP